MFLVYIGRRIIDLRPWIINNLKLVKTSSTINHSTVHHGVRIISPIIEKAKRRHAVENAVRLLQRRIRGRGGKFGFAIAQARQRERMRQIAASLMRRNGKERVRIGRMEASTDITRVWRGYLSRKLDHFNIDRLMRGKKSFIIFDCFLE